MSVANSSSVIVREAQSGEAQAWDDYVISHPKSCAYHMYAWKALIENVFGHKSYYLVAMSETNKICGVLPIVHMKSALFGNFAVSMPYFNYGGVLADTPDIALALTSEAAKYLSVAGASYIEYRELSPRHDLPVKTDKVTMVLSLPDDSESLLKSFKAKLRSQIKRPIREGVYVEFGGMEYLDDFYHVFTTNMRDLGTPPYSKRFFKQILSEFPDRAFLAIVKKEDVVVGASFLMGHKDMLEIPWASTIREYNPLGVNMLMYWEIIKKAIENGYHYFDFGRCSKGSGTYKFKKQWGPEEQQLYWNYSLLSAQELPQLNPSNRKYAMFIAMWKKMPIVLTRLLGPHIVKNIS